MSVAGDEKANWERDEAPTLLSRAEIMRLLDPWLNGRQVLEAELLTGGLMNRNFLLRLDARPAVCVLRIYDRDPVACTREIAVLGMVGREIPVPRVLYADETGEHGLHLAVLSFVDGVSMFALRSMVDAAALAEASYEAGRVLARLRDFPGPPTSHETVSGLIERFAATPAFEQRVPPALRDSMRTLVDAWQPRLEDAGRHSSLVHGDFNSRNVFVAPSGERWRVTGVLDWEFALNASPYVDIGNFLRYERPERARYEPHFTRGLRDGGVTLEDDWLVLARLFDLPALCELLSRPRVPAAVVAEVIELITGCVRLGVEGLR